MIHFDNIKEYNRFNGYNDPKKDLIDVVKYEDCKSLRLLCDGLTSDFYMMAFKRNMTDLNWYGNTEFDTTSAFLYFIKPNQIHSWNIDKRWEGYHILISPILLRDYNIDFSFFQYDINEALFLTNDEQNRIENLYVQILEEYQKDNYDMALLLAYCNLIFTYIGKCYKRQFETRQPLYNKLVLEFKKLLNDYYLNGQQGIPNVHYFSDKLHLSTNYFGDLIKYNTGKTPSEIIQDKIISEAKKHLETSNRTVGEIGYDLGFEYPTYFTRFFKKHTGMTPTTYRENKASR
ncbi:helix-turn-helix domain-containing protein [Chryseobacterium sp. MYb264]|uniref:helix-turn-helix domain-containing protein n=1 Tax=Chryseobacterium sp. MYb264 TaxID=2745153 RepID=UPI002E1326E5|nr:helix-turn-helix domain-containing protein [Chryseobacterium sp. MYb264]